jgi:hypothetical protein
MSVSWIENAMLHAQFNILFDRIILVEERAPVSGLRAAPPEKSRPSSPLSSPLSPGCNSQRISGRKPRQFEVVCCFGSASRFSRSDISGVLELEGAEI